MASHSRAWFVIFGTAALAVGFVPAASADDCNNNGVDDCDDIVAGLEDVNGNDFLDSCERAAGDLNLDGVVNGADLTVVLANWGPMPEPPGGCMFWATVIEANPDPAVVTNAELRERMIATGLPWRVRDTATNIEMLLVPPGTFTMGCSPAPWSGCGADESPTHEVTLSAFYIGRYEVTQAQWVSVMGNNPSNFQGQSDSPSRPVEKIPWNLIANPGGFNSQTDLRLPTEAEWEYAYRAGTTAAFHSYPGQPTGFNDETLLGNIAWYPGNNGAQGTATYGTKAVGGKFANALGLHDMAGNVWEWCQDWYGGYSSAAQTNPTGPATGSHRVLRGGAWTGYAIYCNAARRSALTPQTFSLLYGFRVAKNP